MCWAGTEGDSNVMILELLGPSLEVTPHTLSPLPTAGVFQHAGFPV